MNAPEQALSQKALVEISPAFGSGGLARSPRSKRAPAGTGTTAFVPGRLGLRRRFATASVVSPRRADGCFSLAIHKPSRSRPAASAAVLLLYAPADPSGPSRASGLGRPRDWFARIAGCLSLADWPSTGWRHRRSDRRGSGPPGRHPQRSARLARRGETTPLPRTQESRPTWRDGCLAREMRKPNRATRTAAGALLLFWDLRLLIRHGCRSRVDRVLAAAR
jgi:hypothetical protein